MEEADWVTNPAEGLLNLQYRYERESEVFKKPPYQPKPVRVKVFYFLIKATLTQLLAPDEKLN